MTLHHRHAAPAIAIALALVLALVLFVPGAARTATWTPVLGPPRADSSGAVRWTSTPEPDAPALDAWRTLPPLAGPVAGDTSARLWETLTRHPQLGDIARMKLARRRLAAGDTASADTLWARVAAGAGPWQWPALRARVDLAAARGETLRADGLLVSTARGEWPDAERAEWLQRHAVLRAGLADTATAVDLARQAMKRYPSLPATARLLPALERWRAAQRESLTVEDETLAAEVDVFRIDRASAERRLARVVRRAPSAERWRPGLRRGELLHAMRRFDDARAALDRAHRSAVDPAARASVALERARVERDAGAFDAATAWFGRALAEALPALRGLVLWERAQLREDQGAWRAARTDYLAVDRLGGARADEAAFRAGLMSHVGGERDSARSAWRHSGRESARFWDALAGRAVGEGDSALAVVARRAGYSFYAAAARDTLGRRGWPGAVADAPLAAARDATLETCRALLELGDDDDAAALLGRWQARDPRVRETPGTPAVEAALALAAARLAYGAGRLALGVRLAQAALDAAADSTDLAWGIAPWLYPPAFDSLYTALPARAGEPDVPLLRAVTWQESKFDPEARSRSDARGLMQLKQDAAGDMARLLGDPPPDANALSDPATNLRYGEAYLARLLARVHGSVVLALASYNAGPGAAARWDRATGAGDEALLAELITRAETQDYVKRILPVRQAYRELRPTPGH